MKPSQDLEIRPSHPEPPGAVATGEAGGAGAGRSGARGGAGAKLAQSYRLCRRLNRRYGTSYYWPTFLLPATRRAHVHAVYGFCRYADDIVDDLGPTSVRQREDALNTFARRLFADLQAGDSEDPVLMAVVHTAGVCHIDPDCFRRFLASMSMDLTVSSYDSFEHLLGYMDGSAAVIGEMMLPVLDATSPEAIGPARDLGIAFQLTNFLRDVAEDLDRGRVYLPKEDIVAAGAATALAERRVDARWIELMRYEIARTRRYYARADSGLALLPPRSAHCVAGARRLYSGILDRIEAAGYDVFSTRAKVPTWQKIAVAAASWTVQRD